MSYVIFLLVALLLISGILLSRERAKRVEAEIGARAKQNSKIWEEQVKALEEKKIETKKAQESYDHKKIVFLDRARAARNKPTGGGTNDAS